ncbi:2-dehydro-3-deoxyphosphogluconate aldolase/(4S)-4-hydroxy-2-oxoglutarate aldolase [Paenibacillus sp. DS2015]|uniref:bifunctional 4-hydroxy-2-oxoglutarate aldolase/2-dehydro-3-deoxy-phosphogluconate aldolase n=1 Tax=Paenibacillus sp. DS2015 TaxID=3373917 RepID=UPI003D214B75
METLEVIKTTGVVAVIRGATAENIVPAARALSNGGVKLLEITVESPGALAAIEKVASCVSDVIVGAGTVLDKETARMVILSGAKFVFSPTMSPEVITMAKRYGVVSVPGAFTPTEILNAYEYGADLIKVFPINVAGPRYIKDLHGPLPHIPLMVTGGIEASNAGEYIRAGAVGVGVGSSLVNMKNKMSESYLQEITSNANRLISIVKEAKGLTN